MKWTSNEYIEFSRMLQEKIFQMLVHSPALKDCKVEDLQNLSFRIQRVVCNDYYWKDNNSIPKDKYKTDAFFNDPDMMNEIIFKYFQADGRKDNPDYNG